MWLRTCREAGGRVSTNIFMRDFDLSHLDVAHGRRVEVVVDDLPLFGAQFAKDTTWVSSVQGWHSSVETDGVALKAAGNFEDIRFQPHVQFAPFLGRPPNDIRVSPHPKFCPFLAPPWSHTSTFEHPNPKHLNT